jgi:hypothetical protein
MNRDKNGRFIKITNKEVALEVGQKIHYFQLKERMIIDFIAYNYEGILVNNAIVVKEGDFFYAVHDNPSAGGIDPRDVTKMLGRKYSWQLDYDDDYSDIIFRGWYKPEEKVEKIKYEIGDIVFAEYHLDDDTSKKIKGKIVGKVGTMYWIEFEKFIPSKATLGPESKGYFSFQECYLSPYVPYVFEPVKLKYQKDDLVQVTNGEYVKIVSISKDGVSYDAITLDGVNHYDTLREENIIRKIGTVTKE